MTPVIGDIIEATVGKVVDRVADKYLPADMSGAERARLRVEAQRLAVEEYSAVSADIDGARRLAAVAAAGAPAWTRALAATHRPAWSFVVLAIFSWTVLAPYFGAPEALLTGLHKDIMKTVIIFYFGGRSIEKAVTTVWGGRDAPLM